MTTKTEFVYVTYISTTPEKVWNALQDSELTKLYWGRARNVSDWKVGSSFSHQNYDDATDVNIVGKVIESDPPRRLVLSWQSPKNAAKGENENVSKVTFNIESFMGAVRLTVTHSELDPVMAQGVSTGWPAILSSLKTLLESGQPMMMTTRRWGGPPT